jgi:hypothetical protein
MARRPEFPAKAMAQDELKQLKHSVALRTPHT